MRQTQGEPSRRVWFCTLIFTRCHFHPLLIVKCPQTPVYFPSSRFRGGTGVWVTGVEGTRFLQTNSVRSVIADSERELHTSRSVKPGCSVCCFLGGGPNPR